MVSSGDFKAAVVVVYKSTFASIYSPFVEVDQVLRTSGSEYSRDFAFYTLLQVFKGHIFRHFHR